MNNKLKLLEDSDSWHVCDKQNVFTKRNRQKSKMLNNLNLFLSPNFACGGCSQRAAGGQWNQRQIKMMCCCKTTAPSSGWALAVSSRWPGTNIRCYCVYILLNHIYMFRWNSGPSACLVKCEVKASLCRTYCNDGRALRPKGDVTVWR